MDAGVLANFLNFSRLSVGLCRLQMHVKQPRDCKKL